VLIVIDLSEERVLLIEPDDFRRFSVDVVGAGTSSLTEVVHRSGLGRVREDGEHVVVDPIALRALAGPSATDQWEEGFAAMCAYAAGKGWVEADGGVLAHIE
jgi:predicted HAD superfamily Cof-like phosphohydrolase